MAAITAIGASIALTGCGGGGGSSSGPDPLTVGLIHEWKLDGDAKDSVGTLNGTVKGPVVFTPAVFGSGMVGNGQSTGIALPVVADMRFQNSFTLSAWAKTPGGAPPGHLWESIFFNGDDRPGLDPYHLMVDPGGQLNFQVCSPTESNAISIAMPLNQFVLVTATYDKAAGYMNLYLNGKLAAQKAFANATPLVLLDATALPGIGLGANNDFPNSGYDFSWNGAIDDMRIYNRSLSASEVQALYNQGSTAL